MVSSSRYSLKFAALALGIAALTLGLNACGKNKRSVSFGNLQDGAEVESPFKVEMKAENLVVEPAANGVTDGHGHFHILVNTPMPMSLDPVPNTPQHIHYGGGESETMLDLPVGEHTLILQFAKGDHRPYDPQISQQIKIRVTHRNVSAEEAASMEYEAGTNGGTSGGPGGAAGTAGAAGGAVRADTINKTPTPNIDAGAGGMSGGTGH